MDHLYIKYIHQFSVLVLGTLIIAGIVAFIIQGRDILTVHQEFFSYAFGTKSGRNAITFSCYFCVFICHLRFLLY